jgi:TonB family protein
MNGFDLLVVALLLSGGSQARPDTLETVRQLYASAEYESALLALERLPAEDEAEAAIEQHRYRALCLMALGRTAEAEAVIEQVIVMDPGHQADEQDPPRVRSTYAAVRARVLPLVARAAYADGKAAYDRRDYDAATSGFTRAVELIDLLESGDPGLGDLRTLATGFLDLSRAAATPAPPAAPPEAAPTPPPPPSATPAPAADPAPDRDAASTPPVVVAQELPPWNPAAFGSQFQSEFRGAIEVTIDERGAVTAARIVEPVHPAYDLELLEAAHRWRYEPARSGGQPVTSIKRVDVVLRPR